MIIGQYETRIGPKRRVAIPSKFRKELGDELVIAKWYETCLVLVNRGQWKALLDRITGGTRMVTSPVRDTDRFILGSAFEAETDEQGRIVVPQALAEYAQLSNDVVFVGLGDRVEVWNKADWTERERLVQENSAELIEKLAQKEG